MNIFILDLSEVSQENIYLMDSKKNILMDGTFSKMIYVHSFFSMNGVYIHIPIKIHKIENYSFSNKSLPLVKPPLVPSSSVKQTVFFYLEKENHSNVPSYISMLELLEKQILEQYVPLDPNLPKISAISQTLKSGYFRIFRESNKKPGEFVLKISGIWENAKGYGLSYKIVETC